MAVKLDDYVTQDKDGSWSLTCPVTDGTCGTKDDDGNVTPFRSAEWPTKKLARARLDEHVNDHKGIRPMSTLDEFRAKHGLHVKDGRAVVTVKDL